MNKTRLYKLPKDIISQLRSLTSITYVDGCLRLANLFTELLNLETLCLSKCEQLSELPVPVYKLKKLKR